MTPPERLDSISSREANEANQDGDEDRRLDR